MNTPAILYAEEIIANRQAWVDFLAKPARIRAKGKLDLGNGARCCIGHGCWLFRDSIGRHKTINGYSYGDINTGSTDFAPPQFVRTVGLWNVQGRTYADAGLSLTWLNDVLKLSPKQISKILNAALHGGTGSPLAPLVYFKQKDESFSHYEYRLKTVPILSAIPFFGHSVPLDNITLKIINAYKERENNEKQA